MLKKVLKYTYISLLSVVWAYFGVSIAGKMKTEFCFGRHPEHYEEIIKNLKAMRKEDYPAGARLQCGYDANFVVFNESSIELRVQCPSLTFDLYSEEEFSDYKTYRTIFSHKEITQNNKTEIKESLTADYDTKTFILKDNNFDGLVDVIMKEDKRKNITYPHILRNNEEENKMKFVFADNFFKKLRQGMYVDKILPVWRDFYSK